MSSSIRFLASSLFLSLFSGAFISNAYAENWKISNCLITFKTRGSPVLVSIEGKSEVACSGDWIVDGSNSTKSKVSMDLTKLDTGIALRNKHLRDNYLNVTKFPTAVMTEIEAKDIDGLIKKGVASKSTFKGMLELHGSKKPIQGTYEVKDGNQYTGNFEIDLPDFAVERPSFMGVKVVDKVFITFKFKAER